ncbi:cytidine deaminase [bacterium BMS3Abin03]|nr:cytidine deaminase [bacterium BMS3Abin03]
MDYNLLIEKAINSKANALAPYSNFHVGAALLTEDDKIYTGCNVESSSYSLTLCAERTAIFKAVSEGERKFKAIAVAGDTDDFISPCGACRQVISDLCGNIDIVMINKNGKSKTMKASELLPLAFGNKYIK